MVVTLLLSTSNKRDKTLPGLLYKGVDPNNILLLYTISNQTDLSFYYL